MRRRKGSKRDVKKNEKNSTIYIGFASVTTTTTTRLLHLILLRVLLLLPILFFLDSLLFNSIEKRSIHLRRFLLFASAHDVYASL